MLYKYIVYLMFNIILPTSTFSVPVILILLVTKDELELTSAVHWYSAPSASKSDMNIAMFIYCVRFSIVA